MHILNNEGSDKMPQPNVARNFLFSFLIFIAACSEPTATTPSVSNNQFRSLPDSSPNVWHKYADNNDYNWIRARHAGIAFDNKRQKLYFFGSDTHDTEPYSLDNSVHEFDLITKIWSKHYPSSPLSSYRADKEGRAISGSTQLLPWAMHTFDNILYDPSLDALVVTAIPTHNHKAHQAVTQVKSHPTWIYDLKTKQWRILENGHQANPTFFASASAYDNIRDTIIAYGKQGVWELGPARSEWQLASKDRHHEIHFNMEYSHSEQTFYVFGDYKGSKGIWSYTPGLLPGDKGEWEGISPIGDTLPSDEHYPVAYNINHSVFLLMPNGSLIKDEKKALTYIFNPASNKLTRLQTASLPPLSMNYMMAYSQYLDRFFLVTGHEEEKLTVWSLKLDVNNLNL